METHRSSREQRIFLLIVLNIIKYVRPVSMKGGKMKSGEDVTLLHSLLVCLLSCLALSWSTPVTVSGTGSYQPVASVNAIGEGVVAWTNNTSGCSIEASYYDGIGWSGYETISGTDLSVVPNVRIDSAGNIVALWEVISGEDRYINTVSKPAGFDWDSSPTTLSTASFATNSGLRMNGAGQTIAGWINRDNDTIEVTTLTFGGAWSSITTVGSSGGNKGELQLAISNTGVTFAVWREDDTGYIYLATASVFGSSWGSPVQLSGTGTYARFLTFNGTGTGSFIAAWMESATDNIVAAIYSGGTLIFPPAIVTSDFALYPRVRALSGAYFLSYENMHTGNIESLRYTSGSWDPAAILSTGADNSAPVISGASVTTYTLWTDTASGELMAADYATTGSPSSPTVISNGGALNFNPVVTSSIGLTIAAWENYVESDSVIQVSLN